MYKNKKRSSLHRAIPYEITSSSSVANRFSLPFANPATDLTKSLIKKEKDNNISTLLDKSISELSKLKSNLDKNKLKSIKRRSK